MSDHWGDLYVMPDTESGIAALEREQIIKPRPIDIEGSRLYQPSSRHYPPSAEPLAADRFTIDPITLHTIQLHGYAKRIRHLISIVQQQYENAKNGDGSEVWNFTSTPPIPPYTGPPTNNRSKASLLPYLYKDLDSDFQSGSGPLPAQLDDVSCRKLARRSVAVILAYTGYDACPSSILEMMTDLCIQYMTQMTSSLRNLRDKEAFTGFTGFPDIVEQVFEEMGVGGLPAIHDFYQSRVVSYHAHMMRTCQQLVDDYERVKNLELRNSGEFKMTRVNEEPMSDIQFPTFLSDEEDATSQQNQMDSLHGFSGLDAEHEAAQTTLHQDDTKWIRNIKRESLDTKVVNLEAYDDISEDDPSPTPDLEAVHENTARGPGPMVLSDIMSPPALTTIKKKPR